MTRIIPTEIRQESLQKFKKLYLKKFQYELTDEQSREEGLKLLRLIVALIENIEIGLDKVQNNMIE